MGLYKEKHCSLKKTIGRGFSVYIQRLHERCQEDLLPIMKQVYDVSFRKEIRGEKVPRSENIFSIFERYTDIIVKGSREVVFEHKINLTSGKSNLILDCYMEKGLVNVVFKNVVGSMRNHASSQNMETRLKKWRSGIEANISNLKRGFNIHRCNWKSWINYQSRVLWSVKAYNIRVMTNTLIAKLETT